MATASDDFNRADAANFGANWTMAKGMDDRLGIVSNQADVAAGSMCSDYWSATAFDADQFSEATVVAVTLNYQAVLVRSITSGTQMNSYAGGHDNNDEGNKRYRIWKWVANVYTNLGAHASELVTAGDVLRLEISGTTLTLYANAVQKVQVTDASLATGQPGIQARHNVADVALLDNWSGGDLTAPRATTLLIHGT